MLLPRSSATPYSVTTQSTVFLNVVTAAPGCSCAMMRDTDSSTAVECSTINDWPCSEKSAPRAKSGWPPDEDQYSLPSDSDAHCPRKSTSSVALIATKLSSAAILPSLLVWSTGQNSTPGFSFTNSYSRWLPRALAAIVLFRWVRLRVPVMIPLSIRSTNPSASSSELTPSSLWSPSSLSTSFGTAPMPACSVAPLGIRSATYPAILRSTSCRGRGGSSLSG